MSNIEFYDSTVERELSESGVYASVTKGTSMRPLFKTHRDVVLLRKCTAEPRKYDVVLYKIKDGKYILHRIVKVLPDRFVIRGDNTFVREYVSKDKILAVLIEYNRNGRKHKVSDLGYVIYSRVWNYIYPLRFIWHKLLRMAYSVYKIIFKRNKL